MTITTQDFAEERTSDDRTLGRIEGTLAAMQLSMQDVATKAEVEAAVTKVQLKLVLWIVGTAIAGGALNIALRLAGI